MRTFLSGIKAYKGYCMRILDLATWLVEFLSVRPSIPWSSPNPIPGMLARWIFFDMEYRKPICTGPKCMRALPEHQIASHCSSKNKKWFAKQLHVFTKFIEQLGWSPLGTTREFVEDGLTPDPYLPVMDEF